MLKQIPQDRKKHASMAEEFLRQFRADGPANDRPESDGYPVEAYFLRHFQTLPDALKAYQALGVESWERSHSTEVWKSLHPDRTADYPRSTVVRQRAKRLVRSLATARTAAVKKILRSFTGGAGQLERVVRGMEKMVGKNPLHEPPVLNSKTSIEDHVRYEISRFCLPLAYAYLDPRRFFEEIAPALYPSDFGEMPREAIEQWGWIALLNPRVHRAIVQEPPHVVARLRRLTGSRVRRIKTGRPPGAADSPNIERVPHRERQELFDASFWSIQVPDRRPPAKREIHEDTLAAYPDIRRPVCTLRSREQFNSENPSDVQEARSVALALTAAALNCSPGAIDRSVARRAK